MIIYLIMMMMVMQRMANNCQVSLSLCILHQKAQIMHFRESQTYKEGTSANLLIVFILLQQ